MANLFTVLLLAAVCPALAAPGRLYGRETSCESNILPTPVTTSISSTKPWISTSTIYSTTTSLKTVSITISTTESSPSSPPPPPPPTPPFSAAGPVTTSTPATTLNASTTVSTTTPCALSATTSTTASGSLYGFSTPTPSAGTSISIPLSKPTIIPTSPVAHPSSSLGASGNISCTTAPAQTSSSSSGGSSSPTGAESSTAASAVGSTPPASYTVPTGGTTVGPVQTVTSAIASPTSNFTGVANTQQGELGPIAALLLFVAAML